MVNLKKKMFQIHFQGSFGFRVYLGFQVFRFQFQGFRVQGASSRIRSSGFIVTYQGFRMQGQGSFILGSRFRVQASGNHGSRLNGSGLRAKRSKFRVQSSGFKCAWFRFKGSGYQGKA